MYDTSAIRLLSSIKCNRNPVANYGVPVSALSLVGFSPNSELSQVVPTAY
jgi:hypothetical protein